MNALIVCHAGLGIGLGHLSRSLVIAKGLQENFRANVRLLIQTDALERTDLENFQHRFISLNDDLTKNLALEENLDLVLMDLQPQRVPHDLCYAFSALRATGAKLVGIDGLLNYRSELDLIFIPSFQFSPPHVLVTGAPIIFGWDCFLLPPHSAPEDWRPGSHVLALTGGSDATQLGTIWPELLNTSLPQHAELHWVTGPFAAPPNWPTAPLIKMTQHLAPVGLLPLMQQANYAVTVFGVSLFELLQLGVPTVVFSPYGNKDSRELEAIRASGTALVAVDAHDATRQLAELMQDPDLGQQLSKRSRATLRKSGVHRLCAEVQSLLTN